MIIYLDDQFLCEYKLFDFEAHNDKISIRYVLKKLAGVYFESVERSKRSYYAPIYEGVLGIVGKKSCKTFVLFFPFNVGLFISFRKGIINFIDTSMLPLPTKMDDGDCGCHR